MFGLMSGDPNLSTPRVAMAACAADLSSLPDFLTQYSISPRLSVLLDRASIPQLWSAWISPPSYGSLENEQLVTMDGDWDEVGGRSPTPARCFRGAPWP